jgi:hypothetical protein|tara:strand:+ start:59 stop:322 length:264 start_codon:yes stop_codon:yes gene_type:complete
MSPEQKEDLKRIKTLKIREDIPDDLKVAIRTFLDQAVIVGEYELDHMPSQYLENLLKTIAKYPEHSLLLMELLQILNKDEIIEYNWN